MIHRPLLLVAFLAVVHCGAGAVDAASASSSQPVANAADAALGHDDGRAAPVAGLVGSSMEGSPHSGGGGGADDFASRGGACELPSRSASSAAVGERHFAEVSVGAGIQYSQAELRTAPNCLFDEAREAGYMDGSDAGPSMLFAPGYNPRAAAMVGRMTGTSAMRASGASCLAVRRCDAASVAYLHTRLTHRAFGRLFRACRNATPAGRLLQTLTGMASPTFSRRVSTGLPCCIRMLGMARFTKWRPRQGCTACPR